MGGEVLARGHVARHHVEHAGRELGGVGDLPENERLHRRVGRWLEDDAVPGSQRGDDLRQVQIQRKVERCDGGDHADGLLEDHPLAQPARADLGRQRVEERETGRALREPLGVLEAGVELEAFGHPPGSAGLGDDQIDELSATVGDRLHEPQQGVGPLARRHPAPRPVLEGLARCGHGPVDVGDRPLRHRADHLLGGRVDHIEPVVVRGVDPLAPDVQPVVPQRRRHVVSEIRPSALVIKRYTRLLYGNWVTTLPVGALK